MTEAPSRLSLLPRVNGLLGEARRHCETILLPGGLHGYAVLQPWHAFDAAVQDAIYAALVPVTTWSFGADMTRYWGERRQQDYFSKLSEFILVADEDDAFVGWTGYCQFSFGNNIVLYLDSSGMIPVRQGRRGMSTLWSSRLTNGAFKRCGDAATSLYFAARSESPIIHKMLGSVVGGKHVHPSPLNVAPDSILQCGRALAAWLGQTHLLEENTLILRGAYACLDALYDELPATGDLELDGYFRAHLGPLDAFLLIAEVNNDGGAVEIAARPIR